MGVADFLAELLITGMIDQDSNKPKGCSPWFWVFLVAVILWLLYEFFINKK